MPPKKVDLKKQEADRLQEILKEMLNEEENKYCADCDAKQPRWASWNLGVFLCIRCAGLHRNLGVHISKVKSVSLDTWLPAQVQSMRVMGNAKAKAVYEATLPDSYRRPQNDQALEHFIRAKYEAKKYILKGWIPPKVDVNDLPPLTEPAKSAKKFVAIGNLAQPAAQSSQAPPPKREESLVDLFDTPASTAPVQSNDLFSLNSPAKVPETPSGGDLDDLFGPIVSAPTQNAPQPDSSGLADGLAGLNFSTPATDGKKTTDDIMSLFNNPPPPNNLNQFYAPPPQQPPAAQFPSAFGQAPAQNLPQNNWAANWSTPAQPPVLIPSQPPVMAAMPPQNIGNQPQLANPAFAGFAAPVQTKPADSKAFEDLFSQAQIQFQKTDFSAPKPQQPVATTAPSAQNDLESLFM
ncbi:unnamed protein product [Bursaphelenchus xylophilus]|uniref:(pine wood nematode) hypothetical protein n=1 Tax=Bursaphelenchus xylophilus TaxID=6326 RepID=A0A1I7RV12_BURXY|nr:unnamed protein product [Bursaphelenchus xylophilus]CAG9105220.1 unnamed protein product [Bursaphelenchus xylophilus]